MRYIPLLFIVCMCALAACKKDPPRTHYISARIGNLSFYASGKTVTRSFNTVSPTFQMEGVLSTGATIKIALNNYASHPDTFQLDGVNSTASWIAPTPSVETPAVRGYLIVKTITPDVTGIFQYACADSSVVTGDFNVAP